MSNGLPLHSRCPHPLGLPPPTGRAAALSVMPALAAGAAPFVAASLPRRRQSAPPVRAPAAQACGGAAEPACGRAVAAAAADHAARHRGGSGPARRVASNAGCVGSWCGAAPKACTAEQRGGPRCDAGRGQLTTNGPTWPCALPRCVLGARLPHDECSLRRTCDLHSLPARLPHDC